MAVSKKSRAHGRTGEMPDAAAFVRVLDEGLAPAADVCAAYRAALAEWGKDQSYTDRLQRDMREGAVAQDRPEHGSGARHSPEARLITLHRAQMFDNHVEHQEDQ